MEKKIYTKEDINIERLSDLARLSLSDTEKESFSCDIATMATYVSSLLSDVSAEHEREALSLDELREDTPAECGLESDILALSPSLHESLVAVPLVVGEGKEGADE
jgi:aspartyl/glutamyl-tRNA(Asn/Gln) amidotransferase C subunit